MKIKSVQHFSGRNCQCIYLHALLTAMVIFPVIACATSVVVVRTPKRIVLAADSLLLEGSTSLTKGTACKIYNVGNVYFAIAGTEKELGSGFDAPALARKAVLKASSIRMAANKFGMRVLPAFGAALTRVRRYAPDLYQSEEKSRPVPLSVMFIGVEKKTPTFVLIEFTIDDDSGTRIKVGTHQSDCPGTCGHPIAIEAIGETDAIKPYFNQTLVHMAIDDPAATARILVETEISAVPLRVGPPISVLALDAHGPTWIARGDCK